MMMANLWIEGILLFSNRIDFGGESMQCLRDIQLWQNSEIEYIIDRVMNFVFMIYSRYAEDSNEVTAKNECLSFHEISRRYWSF